MPHSIERRSVLSGAAAAVAGLFGVRAAQGQAISTTGNSGGGAGGGFVWTVITADPNPAVAGKGYEVNTASGVVTVTLPAAPSVGDAIGFVDATGTFATNTLTVGRNALNIMGIAADMTCSTNNASFALVYEGATAGWRLLWT